MVDFSCVVLAGGRSVRMGSDKRSLSVGGKSFLEIAVEKARSVSDDVLISLGNPEQAKSVSLKERIVVDSERNKGPLFALSTVLRHCRREYVALLPVDAPLLNPAIYGVMDALLIENPESEGLMPLGPDGPHPLFGMYNVSAFERACKNAVSTGETSVMEGVSRLYHARYIDVEEFRSVDPKLLSFHNVNTPMDFECLMEIVDER